MYIRWRAVLCAATYDKMRLVSKVILLNKHPRKLTRVLFCEMAFRPSSLYTLQTKNAKAMRIAKTAIIATFTSGPFPDE